MEEQTQTERHENGALKVDFDKLRLENIAMREALRNPLCQNCGGAAMVGEVSPNTHQLRIENARLRDELSRVCALAEKLLGKPLSDMVSPILSPASNSNLELSMGRGGLNGIMGSPSPLPMLRNLENGMTGSSVITVSMNGSISSEYEKTVFMQTAIAAMDELLAMAQTDSPLWLKGLDDGREVLNQDEYVKKLSPFVGMKPAGFITDATRETGSVFITSLELVETMMVPVSIIT